MTRWVTAGTGNGEPVSVLSRDHACDRPPDHLLINRQHRTYARFLNTMKKTSQIIKQC